MSNAAQFIRPPNTLKAKVGSGFGGISADAIAKAEQALASMADQFGQWLNDEIEKLESAQKAIHDQGPTPATMEALYFRAHDLKGLGTTYQYPLVTRLAASLCRLIDDADKRLKAPALLVDAHIDAIRAVVRDHIQTDEHPVGRALAATLEERVAEFQKG